MILFRKLTWRRGSVREYRGTNPIVKARSSSPDTKEGTGKKRRDHLEKDVPAEQYFEKTNPRIPGPHGDQGRAPGSEKKKGKGKKASDSVRDLRDFSFPATARVRSRTDFLKVQRSGRKVRGRCFILLAARNGLISSRFGITVSKKIGSAVERNRVKRKIREIQRLTRREILPGYDVIVIARRESGGIPFEEMKSEYCRLAHLAGLAKKGSQG